MQTMTHPFRPDKRPTVSHPTDSVVPSPLHLSQFHAAATRLRSRLTQSGIPALSPEYLFAPDTPNPRSLSTAPHLPSGTVSRRPPGCRDAARISPPSVRRGPDSHAPSPRPRCTVRH